MQRLFASTYKTPIVMICASRQVQQAVRASGFASLPHATARTFVPALHLPSATATSALLYHIRGAIMSEAVFESAVVFLMSPFHTLGVCRYLYLWVCIDIQIDRQTAR